MTAFLQSHQALATFALAFALGAFGLFELLILRSKGAAIASWVFAFFWLLAGVAYVAGLGDFYNDYVAYLMVALVGFAAIGAIVNRVRA